MKNYISKYNKYTKTCWHANTKVIKWFKKKALNPNKYLKKI